MTLFRHRCLPVVALGCILSVFSCQKDNPAPVTPQAIDLSASGTANSYIVSAPGTYSFKLFKGNSSQPVDAVTADILWETYGTDETPEVGSVIKNASVVDGTVRCAKIQ